MTKPLHSTTWRTESDCGVQVDVSEGRTTEWVPFREIVVTTDAGMSPAEARRLVADLQHAIALAEEATSEDDSEESLVVAIPENPIQRANRQNRAACYAYGRFDADPIRYVPSARFIALVTERGVDTEGFRSLYNELLAAKTAAAEDQPKPRVWHKGDVIPADVTKVYGDDWIYERSGEDAWQSGLAIECGYTGHPMLARSTESLLAQYGALSEALADSEQVAS